MSAGTIFLYYVCFALALGLAGFVLRKNPGKWLNRYFSLAAFSLFAWLYTLYVYDQSTGTVLTLLGRLNYSAVLFVALLGYLFVSELIAQRPGRRRVAVMVSETVLLAACTIWTPLIDRAEHLDGTGRATHFGVLFPLYVAHVACYLGTAIVSAIRARSHSDDHLWREQITAIGLGMLVSAAIGIEVDIILPFSFHDFRYQDVGAFAAVLYFSSVAYSITTLQLFNVRLVIKRTFILTALIALGLEVYQLALASLAKFLPVYNETDRHFLATTLVLLLNAFTQDYVRTKLNTLFNRNRSIRNNLVTSRYPSD